MQKAYFKSALVSHSRVAFEKTCTLISRVRLSIFQQELLAESRRSSLDKSGKDLSRNIEGDSVRRVPLPDAKYYSVEYKFKERKTIT